jgi:hypothetical protein
MSNLDFSNKQITKQNQLGVPIGNKIILGQLTSYNDGSAKWTYVKDTNPLVAGGGDRSTFTLYKDSNGKWNWTPTTSTSIPNLAQRENFTVDQVERSLYVRTGNLSTSQTQTVLNAGNVTNLGGINAAKKLGVPGTVGAATVTGTLPSQVSGGQSNDAGDQEGGSTITPEQAQESLKDLSSKETKSLSRSSFPKNLKYPADLQIAQQDVIKFNMVKYSPRKFKSGEGTINPIQERRRITDELIIGSVFLPIPGGISDTNAVSWGSDSMDPIQSMLANIAMSAIGGGGAEGAAAAGGSTEDIANQSADAKEWVKSYFAQAATGTTNLLSRTQGAITNPNMELLFSGPTLRPFTFNFKLSARGTKDRDEIRQIIRFFKQGMAVQRTQSQLFLKAPHTFKIQYLHKSKDHPYINLIKECALQSFTVNYTPEGNYMTFADGLMTSYEISMQFQELEPIFNDDYGNLDGKSIDTNIGY